eukprot:Lithocolla_globosa_v1_NODE_937_length_3060_cov_153.551747.p3 type:complete len:107 gc:universal NODE_937_length_3060_cov_153.551747:1318-998(-)
MSTKGKITRVSFQADPSNPQETSRCSLSFSSPKSVEVETFLGFQQTRTSVGLVRDVALYLPSLKHSRHYHASVEALSKLGRQVSPEALAKRTENGSKSSPTFFFAK